MIAPRWLSTPTQPIALVDVVRYLAGVAGRAEALGESYDVGGPDVLTYRRDDRGASRGSGAAGRRSWRCRCSRPRLSSYWLHLVTPVRAGVARPLVEGLRNPTVMREQRIRELIPFRLTTFAEAARTALSEQPG